MVQKHFLLLTVFIFCCFSFNQKIDAQEAYSGNIQYIDIINWTHTDYGFTDHPLMITEIQKRYIDIAIDFVERSSENKPGERYTWTVESLDPLFKWWNEATPDRRQLLLKAIDENRIDVNRMPFNVHPMLNDVETNVLTHWVPNDLVAKLKPGIAIQNDVNGFSLAAASILQKEGIKYIWLGMNGRHPFEIPTLSWWKLPGDAKILLWNGTSYWEGYNFFHDKRWNNGQHEVSNLQYQWPRYGDIFSSDKQAVLEAYQVCLKNLKKLQEQGYAYSILPVTFSNKWRTDNDGPFWGIVDFVKKWNELGLKPALRFSTATESMQRMVKNEGDKIKSVSGEFNDWWAFGLTSMPRELSVARSARYLLQASLSPVFGLPGDRVKEKSESINRDLCTFYEHTFAANNSSRDMYSPQNQGTMNEAFRYAYKAYEYAKWQLAQRARGMLADSTAGFYVINAQKEPYTGWVQFDFGALRDNSVVSLVDGGSGENINFINEGKDSRFWVDKLPGESVRKFKPGFNKAAEEKNTPAPEITVDEMGWPVSARWKNMESPLFKGNLGQLTSYEFLKGGWWGGDGDLKEHPSEPGGQATVTETPYAVIYKQALVNDRLISAERIMEIYKNQSRINLKVVYDRQLHTQRKTEVMYVDFPLPDKKREITTSNGGSVFHPYTDNIPNTCKTFYVADAWVNFKMDDGNRVWASKTSPVVSLGTVPFFKKGEETEPADSYILRSMVYNNAWGVNFPAEYTGKVVCEYDLYWTPDSGGPQKIKNITDTYIVKPIMVAVPESAEDPAFNRWLNGVELKMK